VIHQVHLAESPPRVTSGGPVYPILHPPVLLADRGRIAPDRVPQSRDTRRVYFAAILIVRTGRRVD
jgi:hypothetical protein